MNDNSNLEHQSLVNKIIVNYGHMIKSRVEVGWNAYLFTFMFKPLRGDKRAISAQMMDEIDRVYSTFVTRVVRHPKRSAAYTWAADYLGRDIWEDKRPILIACLDGFCKKSDRKCRVHASVNDGLHAHGIMVAPWNSRLREPVNEYFDRKKRIYVKNRLLRIDVRPVESNEYFVVDYGQKALKTRKADFDDIGIWPRAHNESPGKRVEPAYVTANNGLSSLTVPDEFRPWGSYSVWREPPSHSCK
jgi:hypothetical protein